MWIAIIIPCFFFAISMVMTAHVAGAIRSERGTTGGYMIVWGLFWAATLYSILLCLSYMIAG